MKVFWSWQSDTPGKIGRHFVKKTLEIAIKELQAEIEVDEPNRELHLDHDRKGVPGSPDLANTIFEKIRATLIFVADITPVSKTPDGKSVINPNVAIELGYALAHIGEHGLLMVLNSYYGDRESLPFDLKHKAGPIIFSLWPDASKNEIQKEQRKLSGVLKDAIRHCVSLLKKETKESQHIEIRSIKTPATYFEDGEVLEERGQNGDTFHVTYSTDSVLYLRIIPQFTVPPLKQREIKDIIFGIKISPLRRDVGGGARWARNLYGGITFSYEKQPDGRNVFTSSQVFLNREIWGLDATLLSDRKIIPSVAFEKMYEAALKHYLDIASNLLHLKPPFIIEAGAGGVKDFTMAMGSNYLDRYWGPIYQDNIKSRHLLDSIDIKEVDKLLLLIFEDFFDAVGESRPKNFRGFPEKKIKQR